MNELEKDLKRKLDTLCTQYRKSTSMETKDLILEVIKGIYSVADEFSLNIDPPSIPLIDNFEKQIRKFNIQYEEIFNNMFDINEKVALLYKDIFEGYFSNKYLVHLSDADINEYVFNFFESFDKNISNHFVKQIKNGNIWMFERYKRGKYKGETVPVKNDGESFILLKSTRDIQDVRFLAHELMHSYTNEYVWKLSNYEKKQYLLNNLQEVYSIFIEFAIIKFLEEKGYNKKDINTSNNTANESFSCAIYSYSQYFNIMVNFQNDINDESLNQYHYLERYALGELIARYFYNIYKEDSKEGKRLINAFVKNIPKKEKRDLIIEHITLEDLFDKEKIIIK